MDNEKEFVVERPLFYSASSAALSTRMSKKPVMNPIYEEQEEYLEEEIAPIVKKRGGLISKMLKRLKMS
jgi:hypothetical protein